MGKGSSPFVHVFKNMDKFYFFDINQHKIVNISEESFNILKDHQEFLNHELYTLQEQGFLSSNRVKVIEHPATEMLEDILSNKIKKLNLQLTQQCNFRCDYCVYSGGYDNRNHSSKRMNWEVAKKGIDFLIDSSKDSSNINISFYGGEPLIEFELIKKSMEYAIEASDGKIVTFSMTTNGSLLNDEKIEFFSKFNIHLTISLDGPRDIHDKNRKFATNNCGTFETVYNNIKSIELKYPDFKKNIQFSMVIDPSIDLNCLNEFVADEEDFFKETAIMGSIISDHYRKEKVEVNEDFISEWQYNKFKYFLHLFEEIPDKNNSQLMRSSNALLIDFINDSSKSYYPLLEKSHHAGPCIPGQLRLFMNTEGDFFPCERVNENSKIMKIGNVVEGLNVEKVDKLLNVGKITEEECKNCFAFRGCIVCAAMADSGDEEERLSKELKEQACVNARRNFEEMLKDACTLKDLGFRSDMIKVSKNY
ncbi:Cys-rich peptide radical SAM maturase CcpM [Paenibacillus albidus]|uniref:Cys-rich peptide radical SAM maturase CcpM n=1 Tax=Paenibacillus albidus TaxID=2041023 RepID=A0A917CQ19_9BACL|nr:Cys-rich peptide radical SAM maturase CcpM [Paenibacillus albidus]GGF94578.1 Cys-rich peptide radical SAM maturase CcpM [Paenibacillus albidus]